MLMSNYVIRVRNETFRSFFNYGDGRRVAELFKEPHTMLLSDFWLLDYDANGVLFCEVSYFLKLSGLAEIKVAKKLIPEIDLLWFHQTDKHECFIIDARAHKHASVAFCY